MPKQPDRREIVFAYVAARLREESSQRGRLAEICRRTGFSTAHLSNVTNPASKNPRRITDEMVHRLISTIWPMSYSDLESLAKTWWAERGARNAAQAPAAPFPTPPESGHRLGENDPYAARATVLASLDGVVPDDVVATIRSMSGSGVAHYGEKEWRELTGKLIEIYFRSK